MLALESSTCSTKNSRGVEGGGEGGRLPVDAEVKALAAENPGLLKYLSLKLGTDQNID